MSLSFLYYVLLRYLSGAMQAFRSVFGSFGDLLPSSRVAQLENRLNQAETENGDRKRMYEQQIRELEQEQKNESLKNRELTRELEKTQAQMKRFQGELYNTSEQLRLSGYNLAQERSATRGLQTRLDQCQSLLQTRTQELRNAQAILTIDNEPSDSDILRKIGNLNATVFQCSAQLVENWTYKLEMNQGRKDAHEGAVRFLGQEMADALLSLSEPDGEQEIIAQLAVQACFLNAIRGIISTWDLRGSGSQTEEVYTILRKNGKTLLSSQSVN